MPPQTLHVRATRAQVARVLSRIPKILGGHQGGAHAAVQALLVRLGLTALQFIKEAFLVKARGGTDVTGLRWAPLSPYTIARRKHPGYSKSTGQFTKKRLPSAKVRGQPQYRPSWILSQKQRDRWWEVYRRGLGRYKGDKAHAAALAWFVLKAEGAPTLLGVYGKMGVEILRDTGLLYNSLEPGVWPVPEPPPQNPPRKPLQVFRRERLAVVVGTRRRWAGTHHYGVPGRIPRRRLWPDPSRWPERWWAALLEQAQQGIIDIAIDLLRGKLP